jgi:hypothetical protein
LLVDDLLDLAEKRFAFAPSARRFAFAKRFAFAGPSRGFAFA